MADLPTPIADDAWADRIRAELADLERQTPAGSVDGYARLHAELQAALATTAPDAGPTGH